MVPAEMGYVSLNAWEWGGTTSIETYVKLNSLNSGYRVFDFATNDEGGNTKTDAVYLSSAGSGNALFITNDNRAAEPSGLFEVGSFVHIVITMEPTPNALKMYKNGNLVLTNDQYGVPDVMFRSNMWLGYSADISGRVFDGTIAFLRFWHGVALSAEDVATLYAEVNNQAEFDNQEGVGSCFHASGRVRLDDNTTKAFSDLQVGDRIQTADASGGTFAFAPVMYLPHSQGNLEEATFVKLTLSSGKTLLLTGDHFIPTCARAQEVTASALVVGDCLLTVHGKETLAEVAHVKQRGIYTAVTDQRFLVVDGFVASPFSQVSLGSARPGYESDFVEYARHHGEVAKAHARRFLRGIGD